MVNSRKYFYLVVIIWVTFYQMRAQERYPFKVPDTGQTGDYTIIYGEDSDYLMNEPSFLNNGDGTVTDNITGLIWQSVDGGEMTYESAILFCNNLTLGGFSDWRLPNSHELFTILNHGKNHPAQDTSYFTKTLAEYWWSIDKQVDDFSKIWVINAGGGLGAHPKTETISAGGTKRFHVRAVRNSSPNLTTNSRFRDNNDGTITDLYTGLIWQKVINSNLMSWENAISYSENISLAGYSDWRLPNIKELQSLNDVQLKNPSLDTNYFNNVIPNNYWSSTTMMGQPLKAWYMSLAYGLITYENKAELLNVICVRGKSEQSLNLPELTQIYGGEFVMGDHYGYVDPQHPSDELPMHSVYVDSFYIGTFELTNQQYCDYLNSANSQGLIEVKNNLVFAISDTNIYFFTNQYASYSSIGWDGTNFSIIDFRANHPVVGVMWCGAVAYCNWLSTQQGLEGCYDLSTWECDFTKQGFRLPTEAEWEYAGRGGQYNPYYIFPWGNDSLTMNIANWPNSGDPYEIGSYPWTTPIGFYNGSLKAKTDYNWPGSQSTYQTSNGANAYGLYDMGGNVWEFVNDWYGQAYYSQSPYDNPKGPTSGFILPDGKPYRGMRGGNWYNGQWGHSRVANRNPSYYRGPQDPNHPWYHIGFRIARNGKDLSFVDVNKGIPKDFRLFQNYPNPFNSITTINFTLNKEEIIALKIFNVLGQELELLLNETLQRGDYSYKWDAKNYKSGVYFCVLYAGELQTTIKMILSK